MSLQAIKYTRGSLQLLDQRLLPHEFTYLAVDTPETAWRHIKDMVVRGAPAIGVTGVLAAAVDLVTNHGAGAAFSSVADTVQYVLKVLDYLVTSRPTAVNLADGLARLKSTVNQAAAAPGATPSTVVEAVVAAAEAYFAADLEANKALGAYGAAEVLKHQASRPQREGGRVRVLTHCNTGSLATAGYGTALGMVRALHEQGKLEHVYCTETRPYNQGARLTAFELVHDGLPATLVCDSATAYLMSLGQVDAVIVGADRVVANGDTANKIGTHMLAILAAHHGIPFFVAAPTTTLDQNMPDGSHIEIEQRPAEEITHFKGQRVVVESLNGNILKVWNPCFDVTPGKLVAAIVTERGVVPKAGDVHQVPAFLAGAHQNGTAAAAANGKAAVPAGFYALDTSTVRDYIAQRPHLAAHVGAPETRSTWKVNEVGDGNINFVYIVEGPQGGLAVKQSLPFVRCVGESWPLTQERVRIEADALLDEERLAPGLVPHVYQYDPALALIAMEYVAPPAIILRKGLIQGHTYPRLAEHIGEFLAQTLFGTSLLALTSSQYRANLVKYNNPEMCELTEQVIFTDPYHQAANNRHTSPQLDQDVADLQADAAAKVAISALKKKFMTSAEALLHGDLHTGSIMVTADSTKIIDPEFAFYGPMAFDVAKILANLLLALFATHGLEKQDAAGSSSRAAQRDWLCTCVVSIWSKFSSKFLSLWGEKGAQGHAFPAPLLGPSSSAPPQGSASLSTYQSSFMRDLWQDSVAFAGSFIIRRLVGIAHVADMDTIADTDTRAACERKALQFGRSLLTKPQQYATVEALVTAAATAAAAAQ